MCGRDVFLGCDTMNDIMDARLNALNQAVAWFYAWQAEDDLYDKKYNYCNFLYWCTELIRNSTDPKYNLISAMRDVLNEVHYD